MATGPLSLSLSRRTGAETRELTPPFAYLNNNNSYSIDWRSGRARCRCPMYFSSRFAPSSSRHRPREAKKSQGPTRGLARFGRDLLTSNASELKHDGISKSRLVPWVHFRRRGDTSASKTPPPPLIGLILPLATEELLKSRGSATLFTCPRDRLGRLSMGFSCESCAECGRCLGLVRILGRFVIRRPTRLSVKKGI